MRGAVALLLFASACTCRDPGLAPVPTSVRVTPAQVDFGRVIVGQSGTRTVEVVNAGKAELVGNWTLSGEAFLSDDATPSRAVVGSTVMMIRCAPPKTGAFDGLLRISLAGFQPLDVPLSCEGAPVPECVAAGACRVAAWDGTLGRCVERDRDDGTSCDGVDVCLRGAICRAGRCEGSLRDCSDGDPCTADSCHPVRGCEHSGAISCQGEGPCRVGRCTTGVGCELADAEDGTPCGPTRTCALADVCIAGACVQRRPPDGFACAPDGPCGGGGVCVAEVCQRRAPTAVSPSWTVAARQPDGGPPEAWSDLFADRDGGLMLSSYFVTPPRLRANGPAPIDVGQGARRCIEWLGWVVCGDLPALASAPVTALDPADGRQVWSFQGAAQLLPELRAAGVQFFTARLAVLSESELLVLYEARTLTAEGVDPRCRSFAMVVLDRQGQPLRSRFLTDPLFDECSHPHSYGVAVDRASNIYLAFTPSGGDNPATTLLGTTLFSYTPSLQLRWSRFEGGTAGGELAVAEGRLMLERSDLVRSTQTGDVVAPLEPFGLGVAGEGKLVPQVFNASWVAAYGPANTRAWQRPLLGVQAGAPHALATWSSPWGPRDVVLTFTTSGGQVLLEATELGTGAEAFWCPVSMQEPPGQVAVTPGGLGVMWSTEPLSPSWPRCERCDPKYARTRSTFGWLPLPGLGPSSAAWTGAWGGPGHGHRERP